MEHVSVDRPYAPWMRNLRLEIDPRSWQVAHHNGHGLAMDRQGSATRNRNA